MRFRVNELSPLAFRSRAGFLAPFGRLPRRAELQLTRIGIRSVSRRTLRSVMATVISWLNLRSAGSAGSSWHAGGRSTSAHCASISFHAPLAEVTSCPGNGTCRRHNFTSCRCSRARARAARTGAAARSADRLDRPSIDDAHRRCWSFFHDRGACRDRSARAGFRRNCPVGAAPARTVRCCLGNRIRMADRGDNRPAVLSRKSGGCCSRMRRIWLESSPSQPPLSTASRRFSPAGPGRRMPCSLR